ncbi:Pre-mRNA-splicing factor ATP-dependent RNA helicase PRP43 [Pseudolycoriella hygida]|uniref:Pre-mRNA-splicing factor ATP-dependent RNA helicase PRP43 n=1 Tax=Pseudolycoriella hygida TaxID=35572 RepID=A0A9Q0S0C5_9DIPT|nr:Pre-mRNA-splicing factor ATP-dependent RNA helicase PRP43 [Pseudolycoriella hygida]
MHFVLTRYYTMEKKQQYCWKKDACQRANCKFIHPKKRSNQSQQSATKGSERLYSEGNASTNQQSTQKGTCGTINEEKSTFDSWAANVITESELSELRQEVSESTQSRKGRGDDANGNFSNEQQHSRNETKKTAELYKKSEQSFNKKEQKRPKTALNKISENNRTSSHSATSFQRAANVITDNDLGQSSQQPSEQTESKKSRRRRYRNNNANGNCTNEQQQQSEPETKKTVDYYRKSKQSFTKKNQDEVNNTSEKNQRSSFHSATPLLSKFHQQIEPFQPKQPEWFNDESQAIVQHNAVITSIQDQISQIILSPDYAVEYEKHEATIRVLREQIAELGMHVSIYDSFKSRAIRELASKPTELNNQIFREIYRFKYRLGAFAKRIDLEKHFYSGHRFIVVQGATGSGKSTQIPQYIADHPRFYGQKIICTQPRKLAAISLSRRVAFEYSGGIGNISLPYIGFQVGGDRQGNENCRIEFVTEGILLERIMKGDMTSFKNVGCIIVDEAHERSITCDLLLGLLKTPDPRWKDVLIVITSATIDLTSFSKFFNGAPTVEIEGRTYPVDIIYRPVASETSIQNAVTKCALEIHVCCQSDSGDILCFLPGLEDISNAKLIFEKELQKIPRKFGLLNAKVFMLYGKQAPDKQAEVFEKIDSSKERKIIFATDVAETSITIDGVVYVVDSGIKKEMVFDAERNISSLKINPISKSSAIQRAGRCGRTRPGTCYRLYSQDEYESMNLNAAPEVLCKPLSLAVLTLLELSADPEDFDWITSPTEEAISNSLNELMILGAVNKQKKPTDLGKLIAKCQQDPKTVKMIYAGCLKGLGEAACSVASILSVSNLFFWNGNDAKTRDESMQIRKQLAMPEGDVVTMYRIFENFIARFNSRKKIESDAAAVSSSEWCRNNYLNQKSIFLALATKKELIDQVKKSKVWFKFPTQRKEPSNVEIQELMCSGYYIQCARVFHSKNANTTSEYFATQSEVAGRLDFRSSFNLLEVDSPKWIVYDKIVRLPSTIFPVATAMDETWFQEANSDFYNFSVKKIETLPTEVTVTSTSQVAFRKIVGRNFCNVDTLEKELGCLLTGEPETGHMYLYSSAMNKDKVEREISSKIQQALTEIRKQTNEESFAGETRIVVGEGYKVQEILFKQEFSTFYIKDIKKDLEKSRLESILTSNNEQLVSLDCTYHDQTYTAIAKFSSKKDAKSSYEKISKMDVVVTPRFGTAPCKGITHGLNCRLQLTWPTAKSTGVANIFFNKAEDANEFLSNVHYIYPDVKVHVSGMTQRRAQLRGEEVNGTPLTYLKNARGCRFRFDVEAINKIPNKNQLNYKVILTDLKLSIDKFELMTSLSNYNPKSIIVEYEDIKVPASGNGLTPQAKRDKLKPFERFINADTKTSDFFKRDSGVAGICIFFNSNSIAREAYDAAKTAYAASEPRHSLYAPHRLEIEFTHAISIQGELYTFLQSNIKALQTESRGKGITSSIKCIDANSKKVVVKFHMSKLSLVDWIQEKLDELLRPAKLKCSNVDVLFTFVGRQELMKFSKKTYIDWSDETHIIWVYGTAAEKQKTSDKINEIAKQLYSYDILGQEILLRKTVRINGDEGRAITKKCKEAKLAMYHFHGKGLYLSGSKDSVDTVIQFLEQKKYSWNRTKPNRSKHEETRECGVCFCPPDGTFITLSVCGHLFCNECIEPMMNMQPPPFPIKCPTCFEYVALYDIKKLAPAKSLEKVLEMAVISFQKSHSEDIRKCPTPSCRQLLCYQQRSTGDNGGEFLFCDECIASYCISCSEKLDKPIKSHNEDSCENIQNGISHLVFKHVRDIQDEVFNLRCPRCKNPFDGFDGCAAVTCSDPCRASFCGLCLKDCGTNAHPHVRNCDKNEGKSYYVTDANLKKAHVEMRNENLRAYLSRHNLSAKFLQQIIEKIRKDLNDLGMKVPIVSGVCKDETVELSDRVMLHVRKIQDNILTLSCPSCKTAFFDFDGCACVICFHCRIEFCGLCLEHYSNDVKAHVLSCDRSTKKLNIFFNPNELENIHSDVISDRLQSYFDNEINDDVTNKRLILNVIAKDFTGRQIKIPDVSNARQIEQRAREQRQLRLWEQERERLQLEQRAREQRQLRLREQEREQRQLEQRAREQRQLRLQEREERLWEEQFRFQRHDWDRPLQPQKKSECCIL